MVLALVLPVPLLAAFPVRIRLRYELARVVTVAALEKVVALIGMVVVAMSLPATSWTTPVVSLLAVRSL